MLWIVLLVAVSAAGQTNEVMLHVSPQNVGVAGTLRPGTWTPMRIEVDNPASNNRVVLCRWLLEDADGDVVLAQRRVTLNAQRKELIWLYGDPAITANDKSTWVVQVIDDESGRLLASQQVGASNTIGPRVSAIGLLGTAPIGLDPYCQELTSHEKIELVRTSLTDLPDRWFGLSVFNAIVWTGQGGDPNDALVTAEMQQAMRDWIHRGGHLVIVVPAINEPWTGSALADILPVTDEQMSRVEGYPPEIIGNPRGLAEPVKITMTVFDVPTGDGIGVVARNRDRDPVVITHRVGFGAVTMIGVDLADRSIVRLGLPIVVGKGDRLWNRVFNWTGPIDTPAVIQGQIDSGKRNRPDQRNPVSLTRFIPGTIAQTGTVAAALLLAILLFGLYWALAGPVSFFVLRQRKELRLSWLVFLAVVGGFTFMAWGGAYLMRPGGVNVSHVSILDYDATTGNAHTHSWLSVYVPRFGNVQVALDPDDPGNHNTMASPGMITGLEDTGFVDPQSYTIDCAAPSVADIPFRSTSKQFEIDYLGRIDTDKAGLPEGWVLPQGEIRLNPAGQPEGKLAHDLPGTLSNVLFIYCPGKTGRTNDRPTPQAWYLTDDKGTKIDWAPEDVIDVSPNALRFNLVTPAKNDWVKRNYKNEGFLGNILHGKPGTTAMDVPAQELTVSDDDRVNAMVLLSFYDTLPPPDFRAQPGFPGPPRYQRHLGRSFDLTRLTSTGRLIIIAHLKKQPPASPPDPRRRHPRVGRLDGDPMDV